MQKQENINKKPRIAFFRPYFYIMRLDKPIGFLLLLWPTLWALWLAADGAPSAAILGIFLAGVVIMRSAGCVINDICDRHFDALVTRTKNRPLANKTMSVKKAWILFFSLCCIAAILVYQLNALTIFLAFIALCLSSLYPLAKRYTDFPQVILGASWYFSIPMAFAAVLNAVPWKAWIVYGLGVLWTVIFDTCYALADREDDRRVGIRSFARWIGPYELSYLLVLQLFLWIGFCLLGQIFHLNPIYYYFLSVSIFFMLWTLYLIRRKKASESLKAFKIQQWIGCCVFLGIFFSR